MKASIISGLILFVVVVGGFSTFFYINYGWVGLVSYLVFAAICAMPSIISLHRWHKEKGGTK